MTRVRRAGIVVAAAVCLIVSQLSVPAFASEPVTNPSLLKLPPVVAPRSTPSLVTPITIGSTPAPVFAQRYYRGGWNRAQRQELIIGALASIAGGATMVYANRPECSLNPGDAVCGYGAKVIGGSVLAAGVFSMALGALTWR